MSEEFTSSEQALMELLSMDLQRMNTRAAKRDHILRLVIAADRAHILTRETPEQFLSRALRLFGGKGSFKDLTDSRLDALQKAVRVTLFDWFLDKKVAQPGQSK